ncbi:hypothetical protein PFISCL1PPCAC_21759, partial [Pristionchus fissidentatus]
VETARAVGVEEEGEDPNVIRIRVENFQKLTARGVFSPEKRINGFPWILGVYRLSDQLVAVIRCEKSRESAVWSCKASGHVKILHSADDSFSSYTSSKLVHYDDSCVCMYDHDWDYFTEDIQTTRGDRFLFPVGDHKRRSHCGGREVELKDVALKEFILMLEFVYGKKDFALSKDNFEFVLKLADRFDMKKLLDAVEKYLISPSNIAWHRKLLVADQFNLHVLKQCTLSKMRTVECFSEVRNSDDFNLFSDSLKNEFIDRLIELGMQTK